LLQIYEGKKYPVKSLDQGGGFSAWATDHLNECAFAREGFLGNQGGVIVEDLPFMAQFIFVNTLKIK
jgi:hypothetical protein